MGSAVETLCGQAYGAHKYEMLGIYLQRATIVLTVTGKEMEKGLLAQRFSQDDATVTITHL